jgi:hypothetical protein
MREGSRKTVYPAGLPPPPLDRHPKHPGLWLGCFSLCRHMQDQILFTAGLACGRAVLPVTHLLWFSLPV